MKHWHIHEFWIRGNLISHANLIHPSRVGYVELTPGHKRTHKVIFFIV